MPTALEELSSSLAGNTITEPPVDLNQSFIADPTTIRYPAVVYTDAFLNNPVTFSSSIKFYDTTIIPQLPSGADQYERDIAQFLSVRTNTPHDNPQYFPVLSKTYILDRAKFTTGINTKFTEFVPPSRSITYFKG
jgi:hypothetical protein